MTSPPSKLDCEIWALGTKTAKKRRFNNRPTSSEYQWVSSCATFIQNATYCTHLKLKVSTLSRTLIFEMLCCRSVVSSREALLHSWVPKGAAKWHQVLFQKLGSAPRQCSEIQFPVTQKRFGVCNESTTDIFISSWPRWWHRSFSR